LAKKENEMIKTETRVMWLLVVGMILACGCTPIDRPAQNTPKDEKGSPQVNREIKWGDTAKKVEAALGWPNERGTNPYQQGRLKYNHGKKKGCIVFLFGPEQELQVLTRRGSNRESDGLSKIIVMPDLTSADHVSEITSVEPQTLPHIWEAKGFLGDFLKSRGITRGNAPEAQTPE
jgi:hypothetical protein